MISDKQPMMLCCAVLCCAVRCCAVLCCAVLCCAVRCGAVLCCAVLVCILVCSHHCSCLLFYFNVSFFFFFLSAVTLFELMVVNNWFVIMVRIRLCQSDVRKPLTFLAIVHFPNKPHTAADGGGDAGGDAGGAVGAVGAVGM